MVNVHTGHRPQMPRRRKEIEAFAAFAGHDNAAGAVAHLLMLEDGQAHAVADAWRARKLADGFSPASINRESMSALNSLVASARRHELTVLRLDAKGVKSKPYRDTKGPSIRGVQNMLAVAGEQGPEKAARDAAIIRLAYGLGLRRGEIQSLDIGHFDFAASTLSVLGKGGASLYDLTITSPKQVPHSFASNPARVTDEVQSNGSLSLDALRIQGWLLKRHQQALLATYNLSFLIASRIPLRSIIAH